MGVPCYKAVHGTDAPPDFCPHAQTLKDCQEHATEVHEDRLGGDFLVSTTPMFGPDGKLMGSVHIARDITARKRSEEALRDMNAELERRVAEQTAEIRKTYEAAKAERQRLYDVLETLPVYVVLLSKDYRVPFANKFFRERFGESRGRCCYDYLFQRTEACENCESYKVMKTNAPHQWEWTGPDGRNYDIYDFPFADADGSPMIMEMGIDVTEVKRAQAALKDLNATLEQRVAERTAELAESNEELTSFNRVAVGRELRMVELKKQVNELCEKAGLSKRYDVDFAEEGSPSRIVTRDQRS